MRIFFKILLFLIILLLLAAVGLGIFVYAKYDVGVFSLFSELNSLKAEVTDADMLDNPFTDEDYNSYQAKMSTVAYSKRFSDAEIASYINKEYIAKYTSAYQFKIELKEVKFELGENSKCANIKVIFKIDFAMFDEETANAFPNNIIIGMLPQEAYMTSVLEVKEESGNVTMTGSSLSLNRDVPDKNIFNVLKAFDENYSKENMSSKIANITYQVFYGDNGIIKAFMSNGAKGYSFSEVEGKNCLSVYFIDTTIEKNIIYNNAMGINPNPVKYTIADNIIVLQPLSCNGYEFLGFYDASDTKVEKIDAATMQNYVLTCKWQIIQYTITLDLHGGTITGDEVIEYTVETPDFTLPKPTKTIDEIEYPFKGWLGTDLTDWTIDVTIYQGSYGNKEYRAYYIGDTVSVKLMTIGGKQVGMIDKDAGEKITKEEADTYANAYLAGFSASNWYLEPEMANVYNFALHVNEDLNLYCDLEYIVNNVLFYDYYDEFTDASSIDIDSREELTAYIDYVVFYNVTKKVDLKIKYEVDDLQQEVKDAYNARKTGYEYARTYSYGIESLGDTAKFYLSSTSEQASQTLDEAKEYVYTQLDYVMAKTSAGRAADFNNFKINNRERELLCETSDHLYYAIENGYKPVCKSGSSAETMLETIKEVSRQIISDDMNDVEKLNAIYQWLTLNVSYDRYAYALSTNPENDGVDFSRYDSWYLEGVFNKKKAVCEGYAKAVIVLAGLENIPVLYLTGNNHAWNKVLVAGKWYVLDATHGDVGNSSGQEFLSHDQFLITDQEKANKGYTSTLYGDFVANTTYNYFKENKFSLTVSQYIDTDNENLGLLALFEYVKLHKTGTNIKSAEVFIATGSKFTDGNSIALEAKKAFVNVTTYVKEEAEGGAYYSVFFN